MNNSTILKTLVLSVAFALCINVASAQKTKKTDKSQVETSVSQTSTTDDSVKEPEYRWVYSVATVIIEDKNFTIKFEESENKTGDDKLERAKEMGLKMQDAARMVMSETDLLNLMAQQKLELISVTNHPGKEGKLMKYYFRTKVEY
ncbi:hypothetical protein G3O08_05900 [Cryomorpha ignava]|uniref:Uncharacterized protein n=1 Tax=Cryomorpha ignava TaxID=101383 RepID=A0A7K3WQ69_9FLAO|nr:hypothetical protein [Cryomorpha ignava]NEN23032.1 hypothetical protein [Cryomorpha ignava]